MVYPKSWYRWQQLIFVYCHSWLQNRNVTKSIAKEAKGFRYSQWQCWSHPPKISPNQFGTPSITQWKMASGEQQYASSNWSEYWMLQKFLGRVKKFVEIWRNLKKFVEIWKNRTDMWRNFQKFVQSCMRSRDSRPAPPRGAMKRSLPPRREKLILIHWNSELQGRIQIIQFKLS